MKVSHLIVLLILITGSGGCWSPQPSDRILFDLGRTDHVFSGVEFFREEILETNSLSRGYRLELVSYPDPLFISRTHDHWVLIKPSGGGGGFDHYWVREYSSEGTLLREGVLWVNVPSLPVAVVEVDASLNPGGRKPKSQGTFTGIVYVNPEKRDPRSSISDEALSFDMEGLERDQLFVEAVGWEDGADLPFGFGNFLDAQIHDVRSLDPNFKIRNEDGRFYIEWIDREMSSSGGCPSPFSDSSQ